MNATRARRARLLALCATMTTSFATITALTVTTASAGAASRSRAGTTVRVTGGKVRGLAGCRRLCVPRTAFCRSAGG